MVCRSAGFLYRDLYCNMDYTTIILAVLGVLQFSILNALADTLKIKFDLKIMHGIEGAVQGILLITLALILESDWQGRILLALLNFTLFWLVFDYCLNYMRRIINKETWIDWWHLGDAWFDQILKGFENRYKRLILKATLVITAITLNLVL